MNCKEDRGYQMKRKLAITDVKSDGSKKFYVRHCGSVLFNEYKQKRTRADMKTGQNNI